ncbi:MAG: DNA-3-methyladenine glycosylase [Candidatus Limnocylindrales bacterium]
MTAVAAGVASEAGRGPTPDPLPRAFYTRSVDELAPALLGTRLIRAWPDGAQSGGLIVEVEAYGGPEDLASHARSGRTARNATMWGPAGHAYVYRVYGLHLCLNIVADDAGAAGAVLVRAVMPDSDDAHLRARRVPRGGAPIDITRLASGPGNVGRAFGIDLALDGADLTATGPLWLEAGAPPDCEIARGPRIGVAYAGPDWAARPRRFVLRGHPALSRPFPPRT